MTPEPEAAYEHDVDEERRPGLGVSITVCPDGPLLVRGPVELVSADGETVEHPAG